MDEQLREKISGLDIYFSPSAPIIKRDFFFGRIEQLENILDVIGERGQHAVLYGERGVGKTSLANIIDEFMKGAVTAKITCNRTESFTEIWKKIFRRVSFVTKSPGVGFTAVEKEKTFQLDLFLKEEKVDSSDILATFEYLNNPVLFIFDEFDSITKHNTRIQFADTIKALSDNAPHVTLLIVGIADSVTEIIGDHPSIERCIKQIRLPRMATKELAEIIDTGLNKVQMKIEEPVRRDIINFSSGFPHYTHLLAKYAAKVALECNSLSITRRHFDIAITEAIENVHASIRDAYHRAIITTRREAMFEKVVAACALVKEDEHGTFRTTDLEEPLFKLTNKRLKPQAYIYNLGKLCQEERGQILQKVGRVTKQYRYRFRNPLLKAFVRLKLYQNGKLSKENSTI